MSNEQRKMLGISSIRGRTRKQQEAAGEPSNSFNTNIVKSTTNTWQPFVYPCFGPQQNMTFGTPTFLPIGPLVPWQFSRPMPSSMWQFYGQHNTSTMPSTSS